MTRHLVVLEDLPAGGHFAVQRDAEPAPADIARWLDEHPEHHQAVLDGMRVARSWSATHGVVFVQHPFALQTLGSAAHGLDAVDRWSWWAGHGADRQQGSTETKGEAMAEIRRVLVALGWTIP